METKSKLKLAIIFPLDATGDYSEKPNYVTQAYIRGFEILIGKPSSCKWTSDGKRPYKNCMSDYRGHACYLFSHTYEARNMEATIIGAIIHTEERHKRLNGHIVPSHAMDEWATKESQKYNATARKIGKVRYFDEKQEIMEEICRLIDEHLLGRGHRPTESLSHNFSYMTFHSELKMWVIANGVSDYIGHRFPIQNTTIEKSYFRLAIVFYLDGLADNHDAPTCAIKMTIRGEDFIIGRPQILRWTRKGRQPYDHQMTDYPGNVCLLYNNREQAMCDQAKTIAVIIPSMHYLASKNRKRIEKNYLYEWAEKKDEKYREEARIIGAYIHEIHEKEDIYGTIAKAVYDHIKAKRFEENGYVTNEPARGDWEKSLQIYSSYTNQWTPTSIKDRKLRNCDVKRPKLPIAGTSTTNE